MRARACSYLLSRSSMEACCSSNGNAEASTGDSRGGLVAERETTLTGRTLVSLREMRGDDCPRGSACGGHVGGIALGAVEEAGLARRRIFGAARGTASREGSIVCANGTAEHTCRLSGTQWTSGSPRTTKTTPFHLNKTGKRKREHHTRLVSLVGNLEETKQATHPWGCGRGALTSAQCLFRKEKGVDNSPHAHTTPRFVRRKTP